MPFLILPSRRFSCDGCICILRNHGDQHSRGGDANLILTKTLKHKFNAWKTFAYELFYDLMIHAIYIGNVPTFIASLHQIVKQGIQPCSYHWNTRN